MTQVGVTDGSQSLDWSLSSSGTDSDLFQERGRLCGQNHEASNPGFTPCHLYDVGQILSQNWSTALPRVKASVSG